MNSKLSKFLIFPVLICIFSLSACQTHINRVQDCKTGDWNLIGAKDGEKGLALEFDERKQLCAEIDASKIKAESARQYQAGWEQGNERFWIDLGDADGRAALPITHFEQQLKSSKVRDRKTPVNRLAYESGWRQGRTAYWRTLGEQDGSAGASLDIERQRATEGEKIGFDASSYREGWSNGNFLYWERIGYTDAHEGVSNSYLTTRAAQAQTKNLRVREDAYNNAWNKEIIEYWRRLASQDATTGRDVNTRRADAKQRNLKFTEDEYKRAWEQRLIDYWREVGKEDGFGKRNFLEERMANARRDNVFVIPQTRDVYQQAWGESNARFCDVANAFEYGRRVAQFDFFVCFEPKQNQLRRAWHNGREFEVVLRKQRENQEELERLASRRNEHERRLERLEKEIRKDAENKNRPVTAETAAIDKRRDKERQELQESIARIHPRLEDAKKWDYRYARELQDLKREVLQ